MSRFACLATAFLSAALLLPAQTSLGTITGTVIDQNGAGVPNAKINVTLKASNLKYSGVSSQDGTYSVGQLPVGGYELEATASGFKTFK